MLGTEYELIHGNKNMYSGLKYCGGYCDDTIKRLVINNYSGDDDEKTPMDVRDIDEIIRRTARHEIVHAFLAESGLDQNSDWARNEEIVDWIALQGPKIFKAWQEAGAINE